MPVKDFPLDFRQLFESFPGLCVVVMPDMTVAAVTDEYLRATGVKREDLIERNLFKVFAENVETRGAVNIRASIEKVLRTGETDVLPIQKYDFQRVAEEGDRDEERYWKLTTFPASQREIEAAGGKVPFVIHCVEEITERVMPEQKENEQEKINIDETSREQAQEQLTERAKLATLNADIGAALNKSENLQSLLRRCADAMVKHLGVAFARIWTLDEKSRMLELQASSGLYTHTDGEHSRIPVGKFKIGRIAEQRIPHLTNEVSKDMEISDQEWAQREKMVAFAGYPLIVADKPVGVMSVFSKTALSENVMEAMASFSNTIANTIERKQFEEKLQRSNERFELVTRATNDAVWDWNLQTNEVWWNEAVRTMFGYADGEVSPTSKWWYEHIHPDDRERVVSGIHDVIDHGGENWSDEYRYLCADGSFKYILDRGFAIHRDGQPVRMLGAMQDVTARRTAEENLRKSQERLQLVLDSSALGFWYCDLPFDVLNWSNLTKEHFWLSPEASVMIDDFYRIIHPEDRERTRSAIDKSIQERGQYDIEYRTVNPQGDRIKWIRAIGRGFYNQNNEPYRFDGITIDISEEKMIESEREQLLMSEKNARSEAEQANRMKDEFLATLSHELRTPLSSILGWSRLLKEGQITGEQANRAIETIERNAKSQAQLIEDVLDVSRIVSGKMRLEVRPVDLASIIDTSIDAVRPAAEAKNIRLQRVTDSNVMIAGDADRLQQVIWNLLSNAIKFTPKDGRVQIKMERINSHVEVTVADDGLGIEPDVLPFIFERFRQSDSTTTRQYGGLGLGLAIVRHLVELHGGTVQAASDGLNCGSVFTVAFPLIAVRSKEITFGSEDETTDNTHPTASGNVPFTCPDELKNLRVLIVDDEPDTREMLLFIMETCQARAKGVSSVEEALKTLEAETFDVLISDIGMPERDGYDLIRTVRQLAPDRGGRLPAVALTAYARVEDRLKALNAGFQMHVSKPVDPAELLAVVASLATWNNRQ